MNIADKLNTIYENEQKVFEAGRKKEHQEFWNNYFGADPRYSFSYRFAGAGWNSKTFKPTRNIEVVGGSGMFMYSNINVDMVEHLKKLGITINFSNLGRGASSIFQNSAFIRLGEINFSTVTGLTSMFLGCTYLKTIDKLILNNSGAQTFLSTFQNCNVLENIVVEGVIGQNFDIKSSPLSKESIESIVNVLSDTSSGKTVTFKKTAKESAFTEDEWNALIATKPNWTFSLA